MDRAWVFFENLKTMGAKFHYAVFCIFDAATTLYAALTKDEANNLPQREEVLAALENALVLLELGGKESKNTEGIYTLLRRLWKTGPLRTGENRAIRPAKRVRPEIIGRRQIAGDVSSDSGSTFVSSNLQSPANVLGQCQKVVKARIPEFCLALLIYRRAPA
jgi:hypothetical protein